MSVLSYPPIGDMIHSKFPGGILTTGLNPPFGFSNTFTYPTTPLIIPPESIQVHNGGMVSGPMSDAGLQILIPYQTPPPAPSSPSSSSGGSSTGTDSVYSQHTFVDPLYANNCVDGCYPHLMPDKQLANFFPGTSTCMQLVWHRGFELLTNVFPHKFTLEPTFDEAPKGENWRVLKEDAKVRFLCTTCKRGWTSMKGKVAFYFMLDYVNGVGSVKFQLFGQQCNSCVGNSHFEHSMWYPQEVIRVLKVLVYRIGQTIYSWPKPKILRERRGGSPKEKHEKDLCQACAAGICGISGL